LKSRHRSFDSSQQCLYLYPELWNRIVCNKIYSSLNCSSAKSSRDSCLSSILSRQSDSKGERLEESPSLSLIERELALWKDGILSRKRRRQDAERRFRRVMIFVRRLDRAIASHCFLRIMGFTRSCPEWASDVIVFFHVGIPVCFKKECSSTRFDAPPNDESTFVAGCWLLILYHGTHWWMNTRRTPGSDLPPTNFETACSMLPLGDVLAKIISCYTLTNTFRYKANIISILQATWANAWCG
jgi:hypothetical protein